MHDPINLSRIVLLICIYFYVKEVWLPHELTCAYHSHYLARSYTSQGGGSYQIASANSAILDKLWTRVQIEPLSKGELVDVSCTFVVLR